MRIFSLVAFGLMMACGSPAELPTVEEKPFDVTASFTDILSGEIRGDVGPEVGLNVPTVSAGVWDDGDYSAMELVGQRDDRAVMLFISATDAHDLFAPDTAMHFDRDQYQSQYGAPYIGMLGCVGQEIDQYDIYDAPADQVDLVVSTGDKTNEVQVEMTGTWFVEYPGADTTLSVATASFTLVR